MIKLIDADNPILRQECKSIQICEETTILAYNMLEFTYNNDALGLAAPQIGFPYRLFVMACPFSRICFNPTYIPIVKEGRSSETEACLSLPDIEVPVCRWNSIKIVYNKEDGRMHSQNISGLEARVFQHEHDHLWGILIKDYINEK